jgi:hypothetical protein
MKHVQNSNTPISKQGQQLAEGDDQLNIHVSRAGSSIFDNTIRHASCLFHATPKNLDDQPEIPNSGVANFFPKIPHK